MLIDCSNALLETLVEVSGANAFNWLFEQVSFVKFGAFLPAIWHFLLNYLFSFIY